MMESKSQRFGSYTGVIFLASEVQNFKSCPHLAPVKSLSQKSPNCREIFKMVLVGRTWSNHLCTLCQVCCCVVRGGERAGDTSVILFKCQQVFYACDQFGRI